MKVVLSHPTGNRNVRAVLDALTAGDNLVEFDTTIVGDPSSLLLKIFPAKLKREWLRRSFHIDKKKNKQLSAA